jgi:NAD(P)-dependent dehydrogenase (short-subunit alcohol dehydrogenase family)
MLLGLRWKVLQADLTQKDEVLKLEQRLRSDSSISLLLNKAGVAADGLLANADTDQLERMIQLNVTTVTQLASAAAAALPRRAWGDAHRNPGALRYRCFADSDQDSHGSARWSKWHCRVWIRASWSPFLHYLMPPTEMPLLWHGM